ncbi:MAG: nuclear transport factor 2 family protein [Candidatus Marisimplicoccus sp.]
MKNFIIFISLGLLFSCETTLVETSAGYNMDGSSYILGSDENNQIAMDLVLAYADKNTDYMIEMMADSVTYSPPTGGMSMTMSNDQVADVIMQLHSPYDSIKRTIWNSVPLIRKGTDFTRVTVAFSENRFLKDGTQENLRIVDRIFIRDGKIFRVNQWDAEME